MPKLLYKDFTRLTHIKVCDIYPSPDQPRRHFDEYELSLLADSIRQNGIIQPLSVRAGDGGKYILIAGERRLRAAAMCGLRKVPCIIHRTDNLTAAYYSIIENLQRQDLTVFEEAEGINRLISEYGIAHSEVAEQLGIAQSTLSNKLRLLRLNDELRRRITAARLTERHARALIRLPEDSRSAALDHIIAEGLTLNEAEKYINDLLEPKPIEDKPEPPRRKAAIGDLRIFENSLNRLVDTMVTAGLSAKQEFKEGRDFIEYKIKIQKTTPAPKKQGCTQLKIC